MLNKKEKFTGTLTDKELYLIEDALKHYGDSSAIELKKKCEKLILKLYTSFAN